MQSEIDILRDVSEKLSSEGIAYMLTGSVAMSYYAQPRMTRDIDIVVALQKEDSEKIARLFESEYYVSREAVVEAIRRRSMFNIIHFKSVIKVDFIVLRGAAFDQEEFRRRRELQLGDFKTVVISREDLILAKLLWARDSESEMHLKDVRNLVGPGCDVEYLNGWAGRLNVRKALEAVMKSDASNAINE